MTKVNELINIICSKSFLQKRHIDQLKLDETFLREMNEAIELYLQVLESYGKGIEFLANAYISECESFSDELKSFVKTGICPVKNIVSVSDNVYHNENKMLEHLLGLFLTQYLWPNHRKMNEFLIKAISIEKHHFSHYLEIGIGHGLHFLKMNAQLLSCPMVGIDVSQTVVDFCRKLLSKSQTNNNIEILKKDVFSYEPKGAFDLIVMGEVLEHVDDPRKLVARLNEFLCPGGIVFLSTCFNCPSIDHTYIFKNVAEVRDLIGSNNLTIADEIILPITTIDTVELANYAAIIKK